MLVNVCGAENVHPASDAVTVYVLPEATENEYAPLELVDALTTSPPERLTVAPESAPLGPVTVPEMVSVVSSLTATLTWSSPLDEGCVQPTAANDNQQAGMSARPRKDCERSKSRLIIFFSPLVPVMKGLPLLLDTVTPNHARTRLGMRQDVAAHRRRTRIWRAATLRPLRARRRLLQARVVHENSG